MVIATVIITVVERKTWEETKTAGRRIRYPGISTWIDTITIVIICTIIVIIDTIAEVVTAASASSSPR